jgi:1,4-alpha-glucan branching enzyme
MDFFAILLVHQLTAWLPSHNLQDSSIILGLSVNSQIEFLQEFPHHFKEAEVEMMGNHITTSPLSQLSMVSPNRDTSADKSVTTSVPAEEFWQTLIENIQNILLTLFSGKSKTLSQAAVKFQNDSSAVVSPDDKARASLVEVSEQVDAIAPASEKVTALEQAISKEVKPQTTPSPQSVPAQQPQDKATQLPLPSPPYLNLSKDDSSALLSRRVVSPDAKALHLASVEILDKQAKLDPKSFKPAVGSRFHDDGSLTLRVLVGNPSERLTLIGDFNNWGKVENLKAYELQPLPENPLIHSVTLPPGDYHKSQYRLLDQNGHERLDMGADIFSTPAFNTRFYENRDKEPLNAVFWKPTPLPEKERAERIDLRGQPLAIAETDIVSLALKWTCNNPTSRFAGQTGADNIIELYNFVSECGLPEKIAELGYNAIEFMPLDTHVDSWEPGASYFPDWRYSYITLSRYSKHADFGSPDELTAMINAFHKAKIAVILDVVYSHYSDRGNNPPRSFWELGVSQYHRADGWELYGGQWTKWGTRRFTYSPEIRQDIIDAALNNILRYGFDGLRLDNVNGIDRQPYGREFLKEITQAVAAYEPRSVVIAEGYFGDPVLNKSLEADGAGVLTTYSDRFYLWFTEDVMKYRYEVNMWHLEHILSNDWARNLLYYPGNHDEFANPGNPFQTRGRYLAEAIQGGVHNRKIQSWSALSMFASSYYLDMPQLWTLQPGNLNQNPAVDWARLEDPYVAQMARFQADMKRFFTHEPAFASYNIHRQMVRWIDDVNKVVVFEKIDFASGRRVYAVVNLGDNIIEHYRIPVAPTEATFKFALDSDRSIYGGNDHNPLETEVEDYSLEFYLGSYGVVGLVQQDKLEPVLESEAIQPVENTIHLPTNSWY